MKNTQARPTTMLDSLAGGPPNYPPSSGRLLFAMHECEHMRSPEITCRSTARGPTGCEPRHFNKSFSRACTLRSASLVRASQESGEQGGQSQASCNAGGTSVSSLSPISGAVVLAVLGAGVISFSSVELPLHAQPLFRIDLRAKCLPPPCSVAHASSAPVTTVPFGHLQYNCDH